VKKGCLGWGRRGVGVGRGGRELGGSNEREGRGGREKNLEREKGRRK